MNPAQLLEHFDRISEAPDAVARLRRFILDLAVCGKLLEHSANWYEITLGEIGEWGSGGTPSKSHTEYYGGDIPWLVIGDLNEGLITCAETYITEIGLKNSSAKMVEPGTVLIAMYGSIGKLGIAGIRCATNQAIAFCVPDLAKVSREFLVVVLKSLREELLEKGHGVAQQNISQKILKAHPVKLPPLAEQHRIVAKVDELMALCDQLEAANNEREARRDRLVAASLHRIGTAPAAADEAATEAQRATPLRDAARFHLDHLPRLTTRPEHIKQLRQTILNLAVRGRLVPQDPSDEPAGELLARKACLPSGYKRRRKILKEISVDAPVSLFPAIPLTWKYADIQSLYDLNVIIDYADGNHGALYPRSNEFGDDGVTFVTAKDLIDGRVIWKSCAKLNEERANQLPKGWAQGGDVLLTHNATVGRVARIEANVGRFLLGTSVTFYRLNRTVLESDFFYYLLKSSMWQGQLEAIMAQTTRNQVSIQKQAFFRVVVPPLAEQHRIVAKVDELMALCDQLEAQLSTSQTDSRRLLEAVLHEALAPALEKAA
ncbi:MAG: hypothetical protein B7Y26_05175 [Hydrogenophilales bacterium 16-64-46]|nr:MAG: hypothetical protein B7Y26_05175 [Hydrogenophilales bacterium 16-64-46]OZA38748.1 MAG: hypothetical protein B7X87_04715 [Hydrogenophilales bacterium 17-64-34]HQS99631.1 restriction endonuclease subunit S [Thiobacillus sp.]